MEFLKIKDLFSLNKFKTFNDIPVDYLIENSIFNVANFIYIFRNDNFELLFGINNSIDINEFKFNNSMTHYQRDLIKDVLECNTTDINKLLRPENIEELRNLKDKREEILNFLNIKNTNYKFLKYINNSDLSVIEINHNLNTDNILIICFDNNNHQFIPGLEIIDIDNIRLNLNNISYPNSTIYIFGIDEIVYNKNINYSNIIGEQIYIYDKSENINILNDDYKDLLQLMGQKVDIIKYSDLYEVYNNPEIENNLYFTLNNLPVKNNLLPCIFYK